ncbi:hypothetical protein K523DRAFT_381673 [Schizophyllum commune Tattone D]|nr:hypothetical protein K523DRAFT_381673 [Schizophyllum commune Tattone D]
MLGILHNLQGLCKHVFSIDFETYRASDLSRPVSEAIERDDDVARMPDRRAGPVIRRADRARFLTFDHHHATCFAPPAVPSPPPSPISPNTSRRKKSAILRGDRAAQDYADLRITTNAPASGEEEGGCVIAPRILLYTNFLYT